MKDVLVILDNGHGEETPGKRSPLWSDGTQLFEWKYAREIVDALIPELNKLGIRTYKLVPETYSVPLSKRAERVNKIACKTPCIMISVHCNAAKKENIASGWEVWTTTKKNNSDKLAACFVNEFKGVFGDEWKNRGAKEKNLTILHLSNCPCVLTENFFMNTKKDCDFMLSKEGRDKIVQLHVNAIKSYLTKY